MTPEQARQEQISAGRRMITLEHRSSASGHPMTTLEHRTLAGGRPQSGDQRPRAVARPPKGHDAILKAMQEERQLATIITTGDVMFEGLVTGRDKYTITLLTKHPKDSTRMIRRVFYKHAIEQFFGVQQDSDTPAVQ
ncbi:RNA chaperone Hfq [Burkholderia cepacia]|uniref:RNA chaperone Hfq n=1 Tax=Burkholderia cepacia TaxID=292 RepID=UPI0009BF49CC|nr:RNA chaperone Hfq [Burkholderia cepacia]